MHARQVPYTLSHIPAITGIFTLQTYAVTEQRPRWTMMAHVRDASRLALILISFLLLLRTHPLVNTFNKHCEHALTDRLSMLALRL